MAHALKCKGASSNHILGHCLREKNEDGFYKYKTNSKIDPSRTHLNESWTPNGDPVSFFEQRKVEIGVKRKDQITMVDWIITLPQELKELSHDEKLSFFSSCMLFCKDRYGIENVIGAFIHFDETTPHLHFSFTPVRDNKFQCKNILTRQDLRTFHEELYEYLHEQLPNIEIKKEYILNGKTSAGNKTIDELKADSLQKEISELENENQTLDSQALDLRKEISQLMSQKKLIQIDCEELRSEVEILRSDKIKLTNECNSLKNKLSDLTEQIRGLLRDIKPLKEIQEKTNSLWAYLTSYERGQVKEQYEGIQSMREDFKGPRSTGKKKPGRSR